MIYKKKFMAWFVVKAVDTTPHVIEKPPWNGSPDKATTTNINVWLWTGRQKNDMHLSVQSQ